MVYKVACVFLALAVLCYGRPQGELTQNIDQGLRAFGPGSNGDYGIFGGPGSNGHHGIFGGPAWNGGDKEANSYGGSSNGGHDKHQYQ